MENKIEMADYQAYLKVRDLIAGDAKERRRILRALAESIIGCSCKICGATQNLVFHQIEGKKHPLQCWEARYEFYFANKDQFVTLCNYCHRKLHYLAKCLSRENEKAKRDVKFAQNFEIVLNLAAKLVENYKV